MILILEHFTAVTPIVKDNKTGFAVLGNELTGLTTYGFAHQAGILAGGPINAQQYKTNNTFCSEQVYTLASSASSLSNNNWLYFAKVII